MIQWCGHNWHIYSINATRTVAALDLACCYHYAHVTACDCFDAKDTKVPHFMLYYCCIEYAPLSPHILFLYFFFHLKCECAIPDGMSDMFPAEFLVDYVRVYQNPDVQSHKVS